MHRRQILTGYSFVLLVGLLANSAWACDACRAGSPVPGHVGSLASGPELLRSTPSGSGTVSVRGAPSGGGYGVLGSGSGLSGTVNFLDQHIVVANRAGASISVIDVSNNAVQTIPMPAGANTPEPMYFWYNQTNDLLFVGDRANNRVVAFNPRTYAVVNPAIPTGSGVFHMWGSPTTNRLWVVNDIDESVSVINMVSQTPVGTFPTPQDLGTTAVPHDIVTEPDGSFAYVSMQNTSDPNNDFVIKYSNGAGFPEVDRGATGKAPHVGLTPNNNVLYAPSQNSDRADVLSRATLDPVGPAIALDNAHGISASEDGNTMYITTFPGNGIDGLHVIDPVTNTLINSVDTPNGPHNVVTSTDDTRLYITHSGPTSTLVSIFDISGANRLNPVLLTTVDAGLNPFGILSVPAIPEPATGVLVIAGAILASLRRRR